RQGNSPDLLIQELTESPLAPKRKFTTPGGAELEIVKRVSTDRCCELYEVKLDDGKPALLKVVLDYRSAESSPVYEEKLNSKLARADGLPVAKILEWGPDFILRKLPKGQWGGEVTDEKAIRALRNLIDQLEEQSYMPGKKGLDTLRWTGSKWKFV